MINPLTAPLKIGVYQLRNLLAQRVQFFYLDLRPLNEETHELLAGSLAVGPLAGDEVQQFLESKAVPKDSPIVLICENGANSMAAALRLAENSFINVIVIEGGVRAFDQI